MGQAWKNKLKNNSGIVAIYEAVFEFIHGIRKSIRKEVRVIKTQLTVKTHYRYGEKNKDKVFFVITSDSAQQGLYSTTFYMLPFIEYALKKKYIPIIDLKKSYVPMLQDKDKTGQENPWEYYYEQPFREYTLEEVYQSKHVIIMVDGAVRITMPKWNEMFPTSDKELSRWNEIIASYIRLNENMQRKVNEERERLFAEEKKVLGVAIRAGLRAGMMKNEALYNATPKQPSCEEFIELIEDKLRKWKCDIIFLSCDDREYLEKISSHFGEICYHINRKLKHYFKNDKPVQNNSEIFVEIEEQTTRSHVEDYAVEVYLLAQCNSLYSCIGGGSQFAYFLNGGRYEHLEVYDKGLYTGLGQ